MQVDIQSGGLSRGTKIPDGDAETYGTEARGDKITSFIEERSGEGSVDVISCRRHEMFIAQASLGSTRPLVVRSLRIISAPDQAMIEDEASAHAKPATT